MKTGHVPWVIRSVLNLLITRNHFCSHQFHSRYVYNRTPDSKVHGANMGPTLVLSAPGGPHVGPWILPSGQYITGHTGHIVLCWDCNKSKSIFLFPFIGTWTTILWLQSYYFPGKQLRHKWTHILRNWTNLINENSTKKTKRCTYFMEIWSFWVLLW